MTETMTKRPTAEQLDALQQYARVHGRTWKAQLLDDWRAARVPGPLHQLRNTFGPSWLLDFTLPATMGKTRTFATTEQAVRAFVRHGKQLGYVVVLGGGWWEVPSVAFPRRAQGFSDLEKLLLRRGVLRVLTNGGATFTDPVPAAAQVQS